MLTPMRKRLQRSREILFKPSSHFDPPIRVIAIFIFLTLFALLFIQILSRLLLNAPLGWITELATYMLVASIWISAAIFTRMDAHIRIEFFYNKWSHVSVTLKRVIDLLIDVGSVFFLLVVVGSAVKLAIQNRDAISPALHIPFALLYSIIAVSATLMGYFLLEVMSKRK
jgi:TRAP-type C4-dicarboxylate transport system permease small subunit